VGLPSPGLGPGEAIELSFVLGLDRPAVLVGDFLAGLVPDGGGAVGGVFGRAGGGGSGGVGVAAGEGLFEAFADTHASGVG
jgi:hypothetical protein